MLRRLDAQMSWCIASRNGAILEIKKLYDSIFNLNSMCYKHLIVLLLYTRP